jgi:hypothetical protein
LVALEAIDKQAVDLELQPFDSSNNLVAYNNMQVPTEVDY